MRPRARWSVLALAVAAAALAACEDSIIKVLGPENAMVVSNLPDSFRVEAHDLDNVHDRIGWTWTTTGTQAIVHHRSFVHHGTVALTILDAAGDSVYRRIPLEYQIDNTTAIGVAGDWDIRLEFLGARGRIDVSIVAAP